MSKPHYKYIDFYPKRDSEGRHLPTGWACNWGDLDVQHGARFERFIPRQTSRGVLIVSYWLDERGYWFSLESWRLQKKGSADV